MQNAHKNGLLELQLQVHSMI